jgi:hypothetical protein
VKPRVADGKFLQQELPGTVAMASRRRGLAPVGIAADRNALADWRLRTPTFRSVIKADLQ